MTPIATSNVEAELAADSSGDYRAALLAHLRAMHAECMDAKRRLSDRDTFRKIQAASRAVSAAIRIVEKWSPPR